ncbi:MAG: 4-oxalocrotonate tautomerase [Ramlibacter sp.]|jgi:4-oxalocrotonate tautomerase|uniref:tautomerase family protein n=1 Tax=Ramlibacter sp. TaxID=1917967 RepID=UPI0026316890|nr:tautomerase family protein [Ramlibacter sp.]MDB5751434.1 4-oxalocrotonate tautomerase [Ramlibacter sp.]
MPIIQINLIEGRDAALVSECARQVAQTVHRSLGAPLESIRVMVNELPATHWAVGERTLSEIAVEKRRLAGEGVTP